METSAETPSFKPDRIASDYKHVAWTLLRRNIESSPEYVNILFKQWISVEMKKPKIADWKLEKNSKKKVRIFKGER